MIFYVLTNSGNHMPVGVALNWCVCLKADVTFTTHHDTSTWGCHQAKHGQTWPNIFSRQYHSLIFTNIFTIFKSLFVPPDLSLTGNPIPSSRHSVHFFRSPQRARAGADRAALLRAHGRPPGCHGRSPQEAAAARGDGWGPHGCGKVNGNKILREK